MFSGSRLATILVTLLLSAVMAVPVFAQEATATPEVTTTADEATPTPTPEATTTSDVTPTPTPEATTTSDVTPTSTPEATTTSDVTATPTPEATTDDPPKSTTFKTANAGQLTRNGIFGDVVAVGNNSITISTKFGNVTVMVDSSTQIKTTPGGSITLADVVVGDRAAIHLNRSPVAEGDPEPTLVPTVEPTLTPTPDATTTVDATPTPTATPDATTTVDATATPTAEPTPEPTPIFVEPSFREVTARSIHIIPSKASRKHDRTVVTGACNSKGNKKMTVLDEDGAEVELDCTGDTTAEGSDVILLKKSKGKGKPDEVVGSVDPADIDARIENLKSNAPDDRKALLDELKAKGTTATEERLQKLEDKAAPGAKEKVQGARNKGKGKK
jgi:uncharacterized Zn ribbon protein